MANRKLNPSVDRNICSVNTCQLSLPGFTPQPRYSNYQTVRHHNLFLKYPNSINPQSYGVSSTERILTKGVFNKRFDQVVHCLRDVIGLSPSQLLATLALLRFWAYYGNVYPKASQVCSESHCSKATFWRAVMHLKNLGLIRTIPRFVIREKAQISNLYLLHKLLIVIARYLAEHGEQFYEKCLKPYLAMSGHEFWRDFVFGLTPSPLRLFDG